MTNIWLCIILGLIAGIVSGMTGIGGGIIILPALIFFLGFSQHQAQGTTLALLVPPIDLLAAWTYYKQGYVDIKVAALLCLGFILGGWFGAKIGTSLPNGVLTKIFALLLIMSAVRVLFATTNDSV
ncbi:permease [Fischerella major NIES-592]|uniref:Probable membrane transporter protein n=2 Tax=Fischerella TaxID=1190 RepID=A0A1U7H2Y2_9CYAN|nr:MULTISPECIES: sulfite exporter TauE/SafE family protein [Fischerella]MBD2433037.1 sulfite exporter TauE/SafE family protein [Fischerella sp. FACHB-380]OKH15484.1 permease [Fischerella major NIES-592]PMB47039.1 anion permease [Fischerella thermalis CCMEE 5330]